MLSPLSFNARNIIEDAVPPHLVIVSDLNIIETNMVTKDDRYPWLDKDDKRGNMTDREIPEWKVEFERFSTG